ncbi:MAG: hypothetical protein JW904_09825 [Spirochaetales bacterium]|nr:hypothetical protein [Spirochaetales bacterium]
MYILIYFGISLILGLVPGLIALKIKRNFFLWWGYGFLAVPAALLHILFITIGKEKLKIISFILIGAQGTLLFYFGNWIIASQQVAIEQSSIAANKYVISEYFLKNYDTVAQKNIPDLQLYIQDTLRLSDADVASAFIDTAQFKPVLPDPESKVKDPKEQISDFMKKQMQALKLTLYNKQETIDFFITMLDSIKENFKLTTEKADYREVTVPQIEAEKMFVVYLASLKLVNQFTTDTELIERNYKAMFSAEIDFFPAEYVQASAVRDDYLSHLEAERAVKGISIERKIDLLDQYVYFEERHDPEKVRLFVRYVPYEKIGNCYIGAVSLYQELDAVETNPSIKKDYIFRIIELSNKLGDFATISEYFNEYVDIYFQLQDYSNEAEKLKLVSIFDMNTVKSSDKNISEIVTKYLDVSEAAKTDTNVAPLLNSENFLMMSAFEFISPETKSVLVEKINANFALLIDVNDISKQKALVEAYMFSVRQESTADIEKYEKQLEASYTHMQGIEKELLRFFEGLTKDIAAAKDDLENAVASGDVNSFEKKEAFKKVHQNIWDRYTSKEADAQIINDNIKRMKDNNLELMVKQNSLLPFTLNNLRIIWTEYDDLYTKNM